jgi:hypothetical protein
VAQRTIGMIRGGVRHPVARNRRFDVPVTAGAATPKLIAGKIDYGTEYA